MRGIYCSKCHTLYQQGTECPKCRKRWNKEYNDKGRNKERQRFYLTKEWGIVRGQVLDYYCGVDIWVLGLEGRLQPCSRPIVHHIKPFEKYPSLALTKTNLICVSQHSHNEIHEWYASGRFEKALEVIEKGKTTYKEIKDGQRDNFGESTEEQADQDNV